MPDDLEDDQGEDLESYWDVAKARSEETPTDEPTGLQALAALLEVTDEFTSKNSPTNREFPGVVFRAIRGASGVTFMAEFLGGPWSGKGFHDGDVGRLLTSLLGSVRQAVREDIQKARAKHQQAELQAQTHHQRARMSEQFLARLGTVGPLSIERVGPEEARPVVAPRGRVVPSVEPFTFSDPGAWVNAMRVYASGHPGCHFESYLTNTGVTVYAFGETNVAWRIPLSILSGTPYETLDARLLLVRTLNELAEGIDAHFCTSETALFDYLTDYVVDVDPPHAFYYRFSGLRLSPETLMIYSLPRAGSRQFSWGLVVPGRDHVDGILRRLGERQVYEDRVDLVAALAGFVEHHPDTTFTYNVEQRESPEGWAQAVRFSNGSLSWTLLLDESHDDNTAFDQILQDVHEVARRHRPGVEDSCICTETVVGDRVCPVHGPHPALTQPEAETYQERVADREAPEPFWDDVQAMFEDIENFAGRCENVLFLEQQGPGWIRVLALQDSTVLRGWPTDRLEQLVGDLNPASRQAFYDRMTELTDTPLEWLIWWLSQEDLQRLERSEGIIGLAALPTYFVRELTSMRGRPLRGRLWIPQEMEDPYPIVPAERFQDAPRVSNCGGLVFEAVYRERLRDFPGVVTDFALRPV